MRERSRKKRKSVNRYVYHGLKQKKSLLKYIKEKSASLSKLMKNKSIISVGKNIASSGLEVSASLLKFVTPIPGELITQAKKWANRKLGTL